MHAPQGEPLPYNHHLHQFLTFLKHERGFADATIVNRKRSLKPFLAWVIAQDVQLSAVSPVTAAQPVRLPSLDKASKCVCELGRAHTSTPVTRSPSIPYA